jgi:hypothetical protein
MSDIVYQISFSGGMGSAISALIAHEKGLNFNLIFADTKIEGAELHRFKNEVAAACGKEIITVTDGRTPWDVYIDKRWIGNTRTAHCSTELKAKPVKAWLDVNAQPDDPLVLGMDWSEMDRIERAQKNWNRPVVSLLNKYNVSRAEYDFILAKYRIRKSNAYKLGYAHDNCGGFCCKAGQVQFERLFRTDPKLYQHHENEMERVIEAIGETAKPFLRMYVGGELQYLTLKQFREHLQAGTAELPMFDDSSCGCFTDEETT